MAFDQLIYNINDKNNRDKLIDKEGLGHRKE
jgi:hypothetical protein